MNEQRDQAAYKEIPLRARIVIRVVVWLLRKIAPLLDSKGMSPYFSIDLSASYLEKALEKPEIKETLQ